LITFGGLSVPNDRGRLRLISAFVPQSEKAETLYERVDFTE
jgi:hypothetical protein